MLVDFYEKNSHNLYRFSRMVYRDTPMFYKYVSNGYLVLLPDVFFNTGTTHSDMLECVEAAVNKVIELGYADPERIGLHGHSFSGQGHHASKLENKKDFQLRMEQFYDHYLKGKPAPDWMVNGTPYLKKKKK